MLLAIDLGSTVTKAVLWGENGPVGVGRATLRTDRRAGGWSEQDPVGWWPSVAQACMQATADAGTLHALRGIVFSAARQTFVMVDDAERLRGRCGNAPLLRSTHRQPDVAYDRLPQKNPLVVVSAGAWGSFAR